MSNYSHSQLSSFRDCPRQFYLAHIAALRKRDDEAGEHHLRYGAAMHAGIAAYYHGSSIDEACNAFLQEYPRQLDPSDLAKTRPNGVHTLRLYFKHYRDEDRKYRILSCEEGAAFESGGIVHLDRVIQDKDTKNIYGLDTKVTGKYLNFDFYNRFQPNSQINRYVSFIKERFGSCDGFIIDAISMRYRQKMYRGEPAGFWGRFERQMFNPNPDILQQEEESTAYWIDRIEHAKATGVWGFNTDSCWHCTYHPICSSGWMWPVDQQLIEINYRQICNELTDTLRSCVLDRGHDGPHSEYVSTASEFEITVEV